MTNKQKAELRNSTAIRAVYRMYDMDGKLLYVGSTRNLGERLKTHRKNSPWYFSKVSVIKYSESDNWLAVLKEERTAIRREKPAYNILGTPEWIKRATAHFTKHPELRT